MPDSAHDRCLCSFFDGHWNTPPSCPWHGIRHLRNSRRDQIRVHEATVYSDLERAESRVAELERQVATLNENAPLAMVRAWHEKYGQPVRTVPDSLAPDEDEITLRQRLHVEELGELHTAMDAADLVGIADGLADLLYVVYGTALHYGIPLDAVLAEVHRSNMTKEHDPSRAKYAGKVIVKGADYSPPDLEAVLARAALAGIGRPTGDEQ